MENLERKGATSLRGFVSPSGWDEAGEVSEVSLATDSGKIFALASATPEVKPISFLRRYVAVNGTVSTLGGRNSMVVRSIRAIPHPDTAD
jgi:hypothetical protein